MNSRFVIISLALQINLATMAQEVGFDFAGNTETIQVGDDAFPIVDYGSGKAIVLLHGFPDSKELWKYQIPALAKAGYRIIAPDLRGVGNAPRPLETEKYAMPLLINDVIGIIDALGLEQVHLIGHDWGAALSWQLVQYFPHRFYSLTALSVGYPGNSGWDSMEQREKSWYFYLFLQEGVAEKTISDYQWEFGKEMLKSHKDREEVLKRLQQPHALTTALNWYRGNLQHMLTQPDTEYPIVKEKLQREVKKVGVPVLGIWSDLDHALLEPQMKHSSEHSKKFTYQKIEGAGHWMMLDKPIQLNQLILDFLENVTHD